MALPAEQVLQNYLETLWDPVWEQLLVSHHFAPSLRSVLLFADDGKLSLEEFQHCGDVALRDVGSDMMVMG